MVARLHATSGRMQRIVDQLLDITRARLGTGIPVERRETDLDQLVGSVIDELSLAYPATRFESRLAPVRGAWDADRLAQVVSNLVGNAIQHGAAASPVWIETAPDGDDALIRVRNVTCGAPVAEAERPLVFVPRPSKPSSSLGLGLYIADEILRAHRGRISIDATPSTTTFTVRLPLGPWSS